MHQVRFCACALLLLVCAVPAIAANQRDIQAKVFFDTKPQFLELRQMPLDVIKSADTYFELFADSAELAGLTAAGYRIEIVYPSVLAHYRPRLARTPGTLDMGGWKTLAEINARLDSLIAANPTLLSAKQSIGNTIEGRPMWAVKISDNPNVDEDEPEVLFTSAIHAREVITPEVLFYFMDHLLSNYGVEPAITDLVDNREIWFILNVNPDGYYHNQVIAPDGLGMWRKNRRQNLDLSYGVDLNRNFGYHWGWDNAGSSPTPSNETYRGTAAFSEPETQHIRDFMTAHTFNVSMFFHSYSNLVLYPWGYDQLYTPDNDIFQQMADSCAAFNGYAPGPGWGLYVTNGDSDDWCYGEQTTKSKVFAMTIEVGNDEDGFWPALSRKAQLVSENLQPCLFLTRIAGNPYVLRAPAQPIVVVADTVDGASFPVTWSLHDTLNPAVAYELIEYGSRSLGTDSADNFNNWTSTGMTLSTVTSQSLPNSFYTGTGNNLARYIDADFPYHVTTGDSIRFWTSYDLETDWDYAYVEISTDGVTFTPIKGNISSLSNPNGTNRGFGFTGSSSGVLAKFSLGAYVGQDVYLRLSMITDQAVYGNGVYFDDISPVQKFGLKTVISSTLTDTTHTFTGHINGTYYYRVRGEDAQQQWSRFSQPAMTVVTGQFVCVDTDSDGFGDPGHPENTCPTDNCPSAFNPGQADADSDGIGDVCDACPQDPTNDADNDGVCGLLDNCPIAFNPLQEDADQDGIGDACCCVGTVGNVDCDAQGTVDIGDLTVLIDNLFITFAPLCCANEAEFSGTPGIDIGDLTQMISTLFVTFALPPTCPL